MVRALSALVHVATGSIARSRDSSRTLAHARHDLGRLALAPKARTLGFWVLASTAFLRQAPRHQGSLPDAGHRAAGRVVARRLGHSHGVARGWHRGRRSGHRWGDPYGRKLGGFPRAR